MRTWIGLALAASLAAGCSHKRDNGNGNSDADTGGPADACVGLQCRVPDCASMGMPETTVTGTVFAPNGTLPLANVNVYVPNVDPGTFPDGVQCDRCQAILPGEPVTTTVSDGTGAFTLSHVPAGSDIPLIITVGKWRRHALMNVVACQTNTLTAAQTSLPKDSSEGELPKIAITTGGADALECLPKKLGIKINEFNNGTGVGHVHMFTSDVGGPNDTSFGTGGATYLNNDSSHTFPAASSLWNSLDELKKYDIVLMSCEGDFDTSNKTKDAMQNVKQYADLGGRIFLEHYHAQWIGGDMDDATHAPDAWPSLLKLKDDTGNYPDTDQIDTNSTHNPKQSEFMTWMQFVHAASPSGSITINNGRQTTYSLALDKVEQWVFNAGNAALPQIFQFTTPIEAASGDKCGKVVFSDMHVASGSSSSSSQGFPMGCTAGDLTPQEKALAFMFFDIASCVQVIN